MASANKGVITRYECSSCNERHDDEGDAEDCCKPEVFEIYICPSCEVEHDLREDAQACLEGHSTGDMADSCPCCLRHLDGQQFRVEVSVAGHCSTCNPIYTPEQNLAILDAVWPAG